MDHAREQVMGQIPTKPASRGPAASVEPSDRYFPSIGRRITSVFHSNISFSKSKLILFSVSLREGGKGSKIPFPSCFKLKKEKEKELFFEIQSLDRAVPTMAFPHHDPADLRPPLHAHARDTLDSYGGYGVDDLGGKPHSPFHGIDSPRQVSTSALALPSGFCVGIGTSSRRRRRRRSASPHPWPRAAGISYAPYHRPSPPSPAPHQEHHQRARGESSRSPRFHSSSNRTKQSRSEAGHEDSASVRYANEGL
jgi:hypothetical protein